jgi:ribose transport system ATP-binding protein
MNPSGVRGNSSSQRFVQQSRAEQKISGLSGGNQQKICIGRWLVDGLQLLILEEPTRGVDLGARKDIYAHLRKLSDEGLSVIVISTDAEEIGGLADTSTVLIDGHVTERFDRPVDAQTLMKTATREEAA